MVAACSALGLAGSWARRSHSLRPTAGPTLNAPGSQPTAPAERRLHLPSLRAAVGFGAATVIAAQWTAHVAVTYRHGITDPDSLRYHLPFAVGFLQTHYVTRIHFVGVDVFTAFLPANAELLHAVGMLPFRNDVLSPLVNLFALGLAMLAGWCMGRPWRLGTATLLGACLVLSVPVLVRSAPGAATNDVVTLAFLLASVALLVNSQGGRAATAVAALAAGLAVGTKLTVAPEVAVLTVAAIAMRSSGSRLTAALRWLGSVAVSGGFWFARNLAVAGSPVPSLRLRAGPLSLPSAPDPWLRSSGLTVAHYLTDRRFWHAYARPWLPVVLGPAWWAVLAVAAAGAAVAIAWGRSSAIRWMGVTSVAGMAGYLFTPFSAGGPPGNPWLFGLDLRFVMPALAIGMCALPLVRPLSTKVRQRGLIFAYLMLLGVSEASSRAGFPAWPPSSSARFAGLAMAAGLLGVTILIRTPARPRLAAHPMAVASVVAAAVISVGFTGERQYLRYQRHFDGGPIVAWARGVREARIAVAGDIMEYPLYGPELSNRVEYVGQRGPHGRFSDVQDCRIWRTALREGNYGFTVLGPGTISADAVWTTWTGSDPAAREVIHAGAESVLRLQGAPHPDQCV